MPDVIDPSRLRRAKQQAVAELLARRTPAGYWVGELSTSPLSTATAVGAFALVLRARSDERELLQPLIAGGLRFLARVQNPDGGWGDTLKSYSNISTTMLAHAAFHLAGATAANTAILQRSQKYLDDAGGAAAVKRRYGKDHTFSVPILTMAALAGLVPWRQVMPLPFELATLPHEFYAAVRLPVVSYALPALIAIGQAKFHHDPPWNPLLRAARNLARAPSLRKLQAIQPASGGFLEATPLTAFVTMSLASIGRAGHPVARRGIEFLVQSARCEADGSYSWPIDTNLATWVTTLAVNALGDDLPGAARPLLADWLLGQQYRTVHPYTNAAPGGWAWTDLSGGVPDADDTPGAVLALAQLGEPLTAGLPIRRAVHWLVDLQNSDGGIPTFCRGWANLPFDRSSPDLTAHTLRAWKVCPPTAATAAVSQGFRFLERAQRSDGSWVPLWFGNQDHPDEENPTYGTAKVLAAYRDWRRLATAPAQRGLRWLLAQQHADGGWGVGAVSPSSVEETALAVELLATARSAGADDRIRAAALARGISYLVSRVEDGSFTEPAPIGFYFAKLWYFEALYPIIFTVAALRAAADDAAAGTCQDQDAGP